jgi:hypothetical protein
MDSDLAVKVQTWSTSIPGLAKSELELETLVNRILASQIRRFEEQRYMLGSNARLLAVHGVLRLVALHRHLNYLRKHSPSSNSPLTTPLKDGRGWLKDLPRMDNPGRVEEEKEKEADEEFADAVKDIGMPMLDEKVRPAQDGQPPVTMSQVTHDLIMHLKEFDLSGRVHEKMRVPEDALRYPVTHGEQRRWLRVLHACQQAYELAEQRYNRKYVSNMGCSRPITRPSNGER